MKRFASGAVAVVVALALAAGAGANPAPVHSIMLNGSNSVGSTISVSASEIVQSGFGLVNGVPVVITCVRVGADTSGRHDVEMSGRNPDNQGVYIRYTSFSVGHQWAAQTTPAPGPCLADIFVFPATGTYFVFP